MEDKNTSFEGIGNSLIEHVRGAASSRPGIVGELFPYIVQASKKISARAIGRFLEEKHGVKLSYVTIGRALRNPGKYWNMYFDEIEPHAWIVAESHEKSPGDFISEPEKYQQMMEEKPVLQVDDVDDHHKLFRADNDYQNAVRVLDEKWFCFDEDILEGARVHLLKRLIEKPARQMTALKMNKGDSVLR
jgi:hypothetical protein